MSESVNVKSNVEIVAADPTDNIFLELALDGKSNVIISGDHHLLDLKTFNAIPPTTERQEQKAKYQSVALILTLILIMTGHGDGTVAIWDSISGEKLRSLRGHTVAVDLAQFDGDGRRVITAAGDGTVRLWDARTSRRMKTLGPVDSHPLITTVLSQDGTLLAATYEDQSVSQWKISSRRSIARQRRGPASFGSCLR